MTHVARVIADNKIMIILKWTKAESEESNNQLTPLSDAMRNMRIILTILPFLCVAVFISGCLDGSLFNDQDDDEVKEYPIIPYVSEFEYKKKVTIFENETFDIYYWILKFTDGNSYSFGHYLMIQPKYDNLTISENDSFWDDVQFRLEYQAIDFSTYAWSNITDRYNGYYYEEIFGYSRSDPPSYLYLELWGSTSKEDWQNDDLLHKKVITIPLKSELEDMGYFDYMEDF